MKRTKIISETKNPKPSLAFPKDSIPPSKEKIEDIQFKNFLNSTDIKNETENIIRNGLADAIGYNNLGGQSNISQGTQLSQVSTLFNNNRWYLISNMRQLLSQLYVEHGVVKTLIDIPVDDAFRGGIEISTKQLDEDQIKELQVCLSNNNDIEVVKQACKWNRLFGGAGILIITDQDCTRPLNVKAITADSPLEFKAVDMWELYYTQQNIDDNDVEVEVEINNIKSGNDEFYNYYSQTVNKSRVMTMKGLEAPSFVRPRLRGWGFSVIEDLVRSLNQYMKANQLTFELLDELKIDVFKIDGYNQALLNPTGKSKIRDRVADANWQKNYQNAVTMDTKDDFSQKELNLSFIPLAMQEFRIQFASDMRMPLTKLFGLSSAGFNSGEDDIENYNGMIESTVRDKSKFEMKRVVELRCQQLYGFIPTDLEINFKPLRILSSVDEEAVKTSKFARLIQARQAGEISSIEFREACNRDKLLGIQIDTSKDNLDISQEKNTEQKKLTSPSSKDTAIDAEVTKNNARFITI